MPPNIPIPPDVGAALRAKAAARVRSYLAKHSQLAGSLFATANQHMEVSSSLLVNAIETGELHPKLWLSNALACSVEALSATYETCTGSTAAAEAGGGTLPFAADDRAEVATPIPLPGVGPEQFATLFATDLTAADGGAKTSAVIKLTTRGDAVYVEIRNLQDPGPLPRGFYTGVIKQGNPAANKPIALVTLERT